MKLPSLQLVIEQIALLLASLIWTAVILAIMVVLWAYQDIQARADYLASAPPEALAQVQPSPEIATSPTAVPTFTATPWALPPTATSTPIQEPTPTPTWVIPPPGLLPETLNADDPTPVVVEAAAQVESTPPPTATALPPTATPIPTDPPTAVPTQVVVTPTPIPPTATPRPTATPTTGIEQAFQQPAAESPAPANDVAATGQPTYLQIPSVGIDSEIMSVGWDIIEQNGNQYSIWQVADYVVGWHKTSAPLGQPGNTVMAGHHNVQGEVFRDLVNVEVGDRVTVWSDNQPFEYVVETKTIVKEKGEPLEVRQRNAQWIAPTDDERLTLVTCWPYTSNTHRVIVVARPTS